MNIIALWRSSQPDHVVNTEVRRDYCGDHYCTGHNDDWLVCSCGWEKYVETRTREQREAIEIEHRQEFVTW